MLTNRQCGELGKRICEKAMEVSDRIENDNPGNTITWLHRTDMAMNNIRESILNEFGALSEMEEGVLADVYEFIDQYELPYKLQKEFGLVKENVVTIFDKVKRIHEKYDYYGVRINNNTLLCESMEDLIGILNESRLGERTCIGTEYSLSCDGSKIIFTGMKKEHSNEIC